MLSLYLYDMCVCVSMLYGEEKNSSSMPNDDGVDDDDAECLPVCENNFILQKKYDD